MKPNDLLEALAEGVGEGFARSLSETYRRYCNRHIRRFRISEDGATKAWGAEYPSGTIVVEWVRDWWDDEDQLDHAHRSTYGSLADLEQVTSDGATVVVLDDHADP